MATLLVFTVLLPMLGSLFLLLSPRLDVKTARAVALGTALATLALSLVFLLAFKTEVSTPQFAFLDGTKYGLSWMERPDIRFSLGLDGLSLYLFGLTSLLMITAIFASWESITDRAPLTTRFCSRWKRVCSAYFQVLT